uniref:SOWAHA-C winged helix-turn-helix domain-containing protein n=1 Tax=Astyanax mexicanus TaxID=7994 RepID=A0A8B9LE08_ASTMX
MAADFTQDSVLRFLLSRGGTVRNTELLAHFTSFLREQDEGTRARNREQFKRFVNSVAVVKQDGGVSYIALKKKHRQRLESVAKPPPKKHEVSGKPAPSGTRDGGDTLSCAWPFPISSSSCGLSQSQISTSTPCLSDIPGVDPSLQAPYLQGALSQSNDSFLTSNQGGPITGFYIEEASDYSSTGSVTPVSTSAHNRRSLPSQTLHLPSSTDSDWHKGYSWSSDDGLNYRATSVENRDALHHFHEAELLLNLHRPEHLDQAFREDNETSRIKRLQRISSFLNVNHPTSASVSSSRTHSTLDGLSSAGSKHSLAHDSISCSTRQSQVPLESREHEWFVKAASGSWNVIYSLFREDPSLLNKRDFVSGYTVLHWIAKHGDHRVLNTLWYGVNKIGMMMDVDARSACGYTPLHLAAIHSQKNLLRLLVTKFKANVALRDNSGKKPWQYLEKSDDWELMELMGAPRKMFGVGAGSQWSVEKTPVSQVVQSAATVKRHSSLAALFKHKSQLRVSANAETFL